MWSHCWTSIRGQQSGNQGKVEHFLQNPHKLAIHLSNVQEILWFCFILFYLQTSFKPENIY
jgi:hypothetical protein